MNDSLTTQELLINMLNNGWEWFQSDMPGYVVIGKNGFAWTLNPYQMGIWSLIDAQICQAKHEAKQELDQKL